jgi:hypothetical protein
VARTISCLTVSIRVFWAFPEMVFPNRREAFWLIQVTASSGTRLADTRTRKYFQRSFITPPSFALMALFMKKLLFLKSNSLSTY